ncbi:hypothetical protein ACLB1Q_15475 [Escherichia coli]
MVIAPTKICRFAPLVAMKKGKHPVTSLIKATLNTPDW